MIKNIVLFLFILAFGVYFASLNDSISEFFNLAFSQFDTSIISNINEFIMSYSAYRNVSILVALIVVFAFIGYLYENYILGGK